MKILIAEDDLTSQLMIKATVFKAGYEPMVTGDGLSAYEILSKPDAPKLAVLDWMMPGMNGVEVCRKIREIKTNEPAYLILLTSRDKTEDIIQGLKAGADDYIVKPYNAEELQVRIDVGRKVVKLHGSLVGQINELERLRMAVNQSIDGFAVASLDGYIQFVNPAWAQMHGYPVAELIGRHLNIFHTEEQLRREVIPFNEQAMKNGCHKDVVGHVHKDGTIFYTLMTSSVLMDANKTPIGITGIAHDITDLKQAEDGLRESLREKEVLIREVHHRVKNNMQIVSSLLQLQSDHVKDDTYRHLFTEARNRILSMALVHEKLYNTKNMATLDFAAYVKDFIIHLFRSYGINDNRIRFKLDADKVKLNMDDAIPLALMLNELISNSLKHAFPDKREGEISLRLEERQGKVRVELTDNGIGMPDGVLINSTATLGLKLVQALVEQLKGSIKLTRRGGARFILSFKKK